MALEAITKPAVSAGTSNGNTTGGTPEGTTSPASSGKETVEQVLSKIKVNDAKDGISKDTPFNTIVKEVTGEKETDIDKPEVDADGKELSPAAQAKKWGERYKESYEGIRNLFGKEDDEASENAKIASELLNKFSGNEFDAAEFVETLTGLSKKRMSAITEAITKSAVADAKRTAIKELFGEDVSKEEVELFRTFLDNGGVARLLGDPNSDELPEEILKDANGNDLPEATVKFLKTLKQTVGKLTNDVGGIKKNLTDKQQLTEQQKIKAVEDEFTSERLEPLESAVETMELDDDDSESFVAMTLHYIGKDKAARKLWGDALNAKREGENLEYRRISRKLDLRVRDLAEKASERLFNKKHIFEAVKANKKLKAAITDRKEISETGVATPNTKAKPVTIDSNDPFNKETVHAQWKQLQDSGRIRKS